MKRFLSCVFVLTAAQAFAAAGEILRDYDFSKGTTLRQAAKGSFEGPLPEGSITDFPKWNSSEVKSELLKENGKSFTRIVVEKMDYCVLFRLPGAGIKAPGYYMLKIKYRSGGATSSLAIRLCQSPYTDAFSHGLPYSKEWREAVFPVAIKAFNDAEAEKKANAGGLDLYLRLDKGAIDMASIQLLESDGKAYRASVSEALKYSGHGTGNFFRNSRFPLGLPSGWTGNVEANKTVLGPSGCPALKVSAEKCVACCSEAFLPCRKTTKCQVSFAYRGEGAFTAMLVNAKASARLKPSDEWRTATLEFDVDPEKTVRGYSVLFSGSGTLYLDEFIAVDATEKDSAKYASAGDCEIALALGAGEISASRLHFIDEKPVVTLRCSGEWKGSSLQGKIVDAFGHETAIEPLAIPESGELELKYAPENALGVFRVEVCAERYGKRISPFNELVITRVRRPVYWKKDALNSPFGGHFGPNPKLVALMKAAGVNWVRTHDTFPQATCWAHLEKNPGEWLFQDGKTEEYRKCGIKILGWLGTAPEWASLNPGTKHKGEWFNNYYQPKNEEAFRNYVRTVVSHYRNVIDEYHFWNEPWLKEFWNKSKDPKILFDQGPSPAEDYAAWSKIAYDELKRTAPEVKMYGFNTHLSYAEKVQWTKRVANAGGLDFCDMVDYHHYNGSLCGYPGDGVQLTVERIRRDASPEDRRSTPMVLSEGNCLSSGGVSDNDCRRDDCGVYNYSISWKSNDDGLFYADMHCRYLLSALAAGVKRIFPYSDAFYRYTLFSPQFPVLLSADGFPTPTLAAFSNFAWLLEDRAFVKNIPLGHGVWAYLFSGRGASVAVISGRADGAWSLRIPKETKALDILGNEILGEATYQGRLMYLTSEASPDTLEKAISPARTRISK